MTLTFNCGCGAYLSIEVESGTYFGNTTADLAKDWLTRHPHAHEAEAAKPAAAPFRQIPRLRNDLDGSSEEEN